MNDAPSVAATGLPVPEAELARLRGQLARLAEKPDQRWRDSLCERKQKEMAHSNLCRSGQASKATDGTSAESEFGNRKWYAAARTSKEYLRSWIRDNARGKIFLDYACGSGGYTIRAAEGGAALAIGMDLSESGISVGRRLAAGKGLSGNTFFLQGDCEATGLPDESIDTILCSGMLHHLDLEVALPEMSRILKPGGKCLAVEAFKYNPLIWLYRRLTPRYRTRWEENHIIGLKEIGQIRRLLDVRDVRHWHFFNLFAVPLRSTPLFGPLLAAGDFLDRVVLSVFPFSLLAWQVTFEMHKPAEDPARRCRAA